MNDLKTIHIPDGCTLERLKLHDGNGIFSWFRVIDRSGRILGSGFDAPEAAVQAWREVERRGSR